MNNLVNRKNNIEKNVCALLVIMAGIAAYSNSFW